MTFPSLRVFVSSTSEDLKPYREAARDVILGQGWQPVMMEYFGSQAESSVAFCQKQVRDSDLVLLILAHRRGWVPSEAEGGDGKRSITALELQAARDNDIPILALLADHYWPGLLWERTEAGLSAVQALRGGLNLPAEFFSWETQTALDGKPLPQFRTLVRDVLVKYRENSKPLSEMPVKELKGDPAPPQVQSSTGRSEHTGPSVEQVLIRLGAMPLGYVFPRSPLLEEALLRLRSGPMTVLLLHGLAGVGKTTLLGNMVRELSSEMPYLLAVRFDGPAADEPAYLLDELNSFLTSLGRGLEPLALTQQKPERALEALAGRMAGLQLTVLVLLDAIDVVATPWLESVLRCLATVPRVRIVATARRRPEGMVQAHVLAVPPLSDTEAVEFVAEHLRHFPEIDVEPKALVRRLSPGIRSHPQALVTLLAQLRDVPLELLLAEGTPAEVSTPRRLVEQVIASLDQPSRAALAMTRLLSEVDFQRALQGLRLTPPAGFVAALPKLIARSLIYRAGSAYSVPALVSEALAILDPSVMADAAQQIASLWKQAMAADANRNFFSILATIGARIAHQLAEAGRYDLVRELTTEDFLERINIRGFWKEYAFLVRLGLEAARQVGDRTARIRLGCRLARKLFQMADRDGAREALGAVESLIGHSDVPSERAALHSHLALRCLVNGDEAGELRELEETRKYLTPIGDRRGLAVLENQLGGIHLRHKRYAEARQSFEAALSYLAEDQESKYGIEVNTSLGMCDFWEGDLEGAERRLRVSLERCQALGYAAGAPRAQLHLALILEQRGRAPEALHLAREAAAQTDGAPAWISRFAGMVAGRLEKLPSHSSKKGNP